MISLILPYWNRQEAADRALRLLAQNYKGLDLEVVIVDDGNEEPFRTPMVDLKVVVLRLPLKREPKSPSTCWNRGVEIAMGDIIVLSCIEVLHEKPVLAQMREELEKAGPKGYVLAAAWCPETQEWHCHSQHVASGSYAIPKGTGRAFCAMLSKELYLKAGGWDEDYRDGAGYEDVDWIYRLLKAGAMFVMRDDLVVTHPKTGASIAWGTEKFGRNKALLEKKWPRTTFVCLQAGNYLGRGAEYVNVLYDSVVRNMPPGRLFRFVCLTDDASGLHPDIETIGLPEDLKGWWGKLYLFKPGLFPNGERVVYLDLDTLIVGKLDDLLEYKGPFATLIDFYYPERVGPAVMLWEAGKSRIWTEWVSQGRPEHHYGDLWWINQLDEGRFAKDCDKLQDLYPGFFCSYKRDCAPLPPKGTKVVCFHGNPRPHEAEDEWVARCWKVNGEVAIDLASNVVSNTDYETEGKNIIAACKRPYPWLPIQPANDRPAAIVGGGPSLKIMLDELRSGEKFILAVNGAHDYLLEHGITPDAHVVIDARAENARFLTRPAKAYYLASRCAPEIFDEAKGPVTLVHMNTRGVQKLLETIPSLQPMNLISSGSTGGLAAIAIAYCLGHRQLYVYGMDSSYEDEKRAYAQDIPDTDVVMEAIVGGRTFKCAPWMVAQAQQFQALAAELANADCEIHVRSYGLLGHLAWTWARAA